MHLGIATLAASSDVWFPEATLYEGLPVFAAAGLTYLEYNDQTLPKYKSLTQAEAQDIRRRAEDLGLVLWSSHSFCAESDLSSLDRGQRQAAMDLHLRCVQRLGWLGVRSFVVHQIEGPAATVPLRLPYGLESVARLCEAGADCGVRILIENFAQFDCRQVRRFAEQLGSDNLGIVLDIGHAHHTPRSEPDEIATCGDLLLSLHVHDNHGPASGDEHLPPGYGTTDWPPILRALDSVGYTGPFLMEVFPRTKGTVADAHAFVREAADAARQVLAGRA
jgi:sugar phosphate isomerase/epimerase